MNIFNFLDLLPTLTKIYAYPTEANKEEIDMLISIIDNSIFANLPFYECSINDML